MNDSGFMECIVCKAKPRVSALCNSCLHNRQVIWEQARRIRKADQIIKEKTPEEVLKERVEHLRKRSEQSLRDSSLREKVQKLQEEIRFLRERLADLVFFLR